MKHTTLCPTCKGPLTIYAVPHGLGNLIKSYTTSCECLDALDVDDREFLLYSALVSSTEDS